MNALITASRTLKETTYDEKACTKGTSNEDGEVVGLLLLYRYSLVAAGDLD